ncbi:MAG: hypothetical protein ACYTGA_14015 [Planctomycetota bacterium]
MDGIKLFENALGEHYFKFFMDFLYLQAMKPECWLTLSAPSRLLQSKQKLVPSLSQSPTHPQYPRRHHPSHRVRHYACLMQARARRSPCANRTRCPSIRATQAFVVCVTIRPFGGSGPLGSGPSPCAGLAAGLCLGVAPYPLPTTYWGLAGTTQSMQIIEA